MPGAATAPHRGRQRRPPVRLLASARDNTNAGAMTITARERQDKAGVAAGADQPLLSVADLRVAYKVGGKSLAAVSGVSFAIARGETLGLVGESGCGKSTLARAILRLTRATSGQIIFDNIDLGLLEGAALRAVRRRVQIIFQDPIASLNPRRRVGDILAEPLLITGVSDKAERDRRIADVLSAVGLDPGLVLERFAHE